MSQLAHLQHAHATCEAAKKLSRSVPKVGCGKHRRGLTRVLGLLWAPVPFGVPVGVPVGVPFGSLVGGGALLFFVPSADEGDL